MRWSPLILGSVVLSLSSSVFALPLESSRLVTRADSVRQSSSTVRKNAADNAGGHIDKDKDAGHIVPVESFDTATKSAGLSPGGLSKDIKDIANKQVQPEPSGQNRAAGRQEAKNADKIASGDSPTQPVNAGHREFQQEHRQQGLDAAKQFDQAVKDEHGVDPGMADHAKQMLDDQPCKRDLVDEDGMLNVRALYDENGELDRRALSCALPQRKGSASKSAAGKSAASGKKSAPGKTKSSSKKPKTNSASKKGQGSKSTKGQGSKSTKGQGSRSTKSQGSKSKKSQAKPKSTKSNSQKKGQSQKENSQQAGKKQTKAAVPKAQAKIQSPKKQTSTGSTPKTQSKPGKK